MQYSEVANLWLNTLSNTVSGGLFTIKSDSKFTLSNRDICVDILKNKTYNRIYQSVISNMIYYMEMK